VSKFTQYELRQVYAESEFLVMPLYDVEFQAGVTALLEGMAMEKAIVCTQTIGQTDVVIDGETGIYVPPNDPTAFKQAITQLLNDPACMERMGHAGRQRIENEMSLACYIDRLDTFVQQACKVILAE
jgi:glycosyltransferase involved in cell wall biosynthesis